MTLPRALAVASVLMLAGVWQAAAQFPPPPGQAGAPAGQASPFPPPPGQGSPFPQPGQASPFPMPGQAPGRDPCEGFVPIRQETEKSAGAIRAASERKASREEVCPLFKTFAANHAKMTKFLETHQTMCRIPPDVVKGAKIEHARLVQTRNQVCSAGPGPSGPSLSDALGAPILPDTAPKPGRGTFDTLTGSPLGR